MKASAVLTFFPALCFILFGCKKPDLLTANNGSTNPVVPVLFDNSFYTITQKGTSSVKSEILFALDSKTVGKIFLVNENGSIIKEKSVGSDVQNLQKWNINGNIRYTYFLSVGAKTLDSIPGIELGYEFICDAGLNILDSVGFQIFNNINSDELDSHEFILLGEHHYICETYYQEKPDNIPDSLHPTSGVKVAACIIQEVNNGEVVFQWDATKFPEFYSCSQENNNFSDEKTTHDYLHLNSICVDSADDNLIVSFRNLNEIVKLNRQTGDIMWRLGGKYSNFLQTGDELFLRQHYARIIENGKTLIFLDNGLDKTRNYSRILEFQLDEKARTIKGFTSFQIPDKFIQFAGSVQKKGDEYFIGGGSAKYAVRVNYKTIDILLRLNLYFPSYRTLEY
jgi:arylsulfate sulfotransferase